jgi:hypothetical protein
MAAPFAMRSSATSACPAKVARSAVSRLARYARRSLPLPRSAREPSRDHPHARLMEWSGECKRNAGKEHGQGYGDLNHFRPPCIVSGYVRDNRRGEILVESRRADAAILLDRLTTSASIAAAVLVHLSERSPVYEALPGEPVGDVPWQPGKARTVGTDQGILFDLPALTIGDNRGRL